FYRTQIDYPAADFLAIRGPAGAPDRGDGAAAGADGGLPGADGGLPGAAGAAAGTGGAPLVLFSGGKDSLALARIVAAARGAAPVDFFLYNPEARLRGMAGSLAAGAPALQAHPELPPTLLNLTPAHH